MLRKLQLGDASKMLEWMHDENVVRDLHTDFQKMTIDDCKRFIMESNRNSQDLHYAIVNAEGIYVGTVSLKNIDLKEKSAEFAIVISPIVMGKGYAKEAMDEIIKIGFKKYGLERIFWCVSKENKRAIRFYEKHGYEKSACPLKAPKNYSKQQIDSYIWFEINNTDC